MPRIHHCVACGSPDHNRATCPSVYGPRKPPRRTDSKAQLAARAVVAEQLTLREAAARFCISHQAVSQAHERLFNEQPTPHAADEQLTREALLDQLRNDATLEQLVAASGMSASAIRRIAARAGLKIHRADPRAAAWSAALIAVRGGATIAAAAAEHGVSYGRLYERARAAGIHTKPSGRPATYGLAKQAAVLVVEQSIKVPDAARLFCVSPSAVRIAVARMQPCSSEVR